MRRVDLVVVLAVIALGAWVLRPVAPAPPASAPASAALPPDANRLTLDGVRLGMTGAELAAIKGKPVEVRRPFAGWEDWVYIGAATGWNQSFVLREGKVAFMSAVADLAIDGKVVHTKERVLELLAEPDRRVPNTLEPPNEIWYYNRYALVLKINQGKTQCATIGNY